MKINVFIDKNRQEEVLVYAHERNKLVEEIELLCQSDGIELLGFKDKEGIKLDINEICCFIVESNKIYALTKKDRYLLKCRLYSLEESLGRSFVKINQSCIANLKMIERFDASYSGSLTVKFKNGYTDYVSRRNLKNVKERLGL